MIRMREYPSTLRSYLMAGNKVISVRFHEFGPFFATDVHNTWTARMKSAAIWWVEETGNVSGQDNSLTNKIRIRDRHRRQ